MDNFVKFNNNSYTLTTQKSWHETMEELEYTFRLWGVKEWNTNTPGGAPLNSYRPQSEQDRTVTITYIKNGKTVTLSMGKQDRAVDNLRVLYLAIEAMRMNEKRGIGEVIANAYLQLEAPPEVKDPYEVLEIRNNASLEIAEAAYKAKVRKVHPDRGGSEQHMKVLNQAIDAIRRKVK